MLAYLFWHRPAPGVDLTRYESALRRFHQSMREDPASGLVSNVSYRLAGIPWLAGSDEKEFGGGPGFEDWYLVEDSGALDRLNEAAIDARHRTFHDAAAILAGDGAGGLYSLVRPAAAPESERTPGDRSDSVWLSKPRGVPYSQFMPDLMSSAPSDARIWQRRLVLGPAPEFCIEHAGSADEPTPGADVVTITRSLLI